MPMLPEQIDPILALARAFNKPYQRGLHPTQFYGREQKGLFSKPVDERFTNSPELSAFRTNNPNADRTDKVNFYDDPKINKGSLKDLLTLRELLGR